MTNWQKWFFNVLFLLLIGCEEEMVTAGKPASAFNWAYGTGAVKTDPAGKAEDGYINEQLPYPYLNDHLNKLGLWTQFIDRAFGTAYYVKCSTGNDTTGDGTASLPFKTVKKAVDSVEDGGYGTVIVSEAANCVIDADINMTAKSVRIVNTTNTLASDFNFTAYTDAGENNIYGFNLYQGANLVIWSKNINIPAPLVTGNDWKAGASCIRVFDQLSSVSVSAVTNITFSATAATGTDLPSLVKNDGTLVALGTANATVIGTIVSNSKGYVFDANSLVGTLNAFGTIDHDINWLTGGVDDEQPTLISGVIGDTTGGGTTLSIRSGSEAIAAGTGTEVESKIVDLLTDAYGNITAGDVAGVKTTTGGNLVAIQATISGGSSNVIIGDIKSVANTTTYLNVTQGYILKNINVTTNLTALK